MQSVNSLVACHIAQAQEEKCKKAGNKSKKSNQQ
jgi:hypothetical protein